MRLWFAMECYRNSILWRLDLALMYLVTRNSALTEQVTKRCPLDASSIQMILDECLVTNLFVRAIVACERHIERFKDPKVTLPHHRSRTELSGAVVLMRAGEDMLMSYDAVKIANDQGVQIKVEHRAIKQPRAKQLQLRPPSRPICNQRDTFAGDGNIRETYKAMRGCYITLYASLETLYPCIRIDASRA